MQIISHRGYWITPTEMNQPQAFERALQLCFGIETDIRDRGSQTVISHDPPVQDAMSLDDFLAIFTAHPSSLPLALNIKADGLQACVRDALDRYNIQSAFVFDMSVPDLLGYLALGVPVFVRHSDIEPDPVLYGQARGIWLDQFYSDWVTPADIFHHLDRRKLVCLVSPELHRRDYTRQWEQLAASDVIRHENFMICTDFPVIAQEVFDV